MGLNQSAVVSPRLNLLLSKSGTVIPEVWGVTLLPQLACSSLSDPAVVVESARASVHSVVAVNPVEALVAGFGYFHMWMGRLRLGKRRRLDVPLPG